MMASGIDWLASKGLNLFACFDCTQLPSPILEVITGNGFDIKRFPRLVLIGHGGRRLWEEIRQAELRTEHPFDEISIVLTQRFLHDYLDDPPAHFLYPTTNIPLPLQQLGILAGWHHPSPMGIGINGVYGLWFAYRVALLTTDAVEPTLPMAAASPCEQCRDRPCVPACPARAVGKVGDFQATSCFTHRLKVDSSCAARCLSRLACPYFPEHRYRDEQVRYHYELSVDTLRRYNNLTASESVEESP